MNYRYKFASHSANGAPGELLRFFVGVGMMLVGSYLFFKNLSVSSSYYTMWGRDSSGLGLLALLIGIGVLFFSGRSWLGWGLVAVGMGVVILNVINNLTIYFMPTNMWNTVVMLGLIFGGMGLVARALKSVS